MELNLIIQMFLCIAHVFNKRLVNQRYGKAAWTSLELVTRAMHTIYRLVTSG